MNPQSLHWIAAACAATFDRTSINPPVHRVVTDSRVAGPGDLFVALQGERFDGHDYLSEVAARGVNAVLIDATRRHQVPPGVLVLGSPSPRAAYGRLAGTYRQQFSLPVVCVAGSNGKTTTKDLVAAVLSAQFPTLKSEASFNNDVGVPATLLRIDATHRAAVLEAGTNHPGELAPLVRLIAPQIGILTSFGREHLEFFQDLAGVVREEGSLAEEIPAGGQLLLDGDSAFADEVSQRCRPGVQVIRVGFQPHNDWQIEQTSQDWEGLTFRIRAVIQPDWSGLWRVPMPGRHTARNATYALAVAAKLGVNPAAARTALAAFPSPKQRLALGNAGGVRIVDDTYNANADSMLAALRTLTDLPCTGRRVAVLGDMGELGSMTETAHVEVGQTSAQFLDALFAIGQQATSTVQAARAAGLQQGGAFDTVEDALPAIGDYLRPGDTVLVKASRSARLERVVAYLRERFSPVTQKLPESAAA